MPNQTNVNTGNAGEYFVAGELERRGFTVALPMSNVKDFDILAINRKTHDQFAIQVKTTGYKQKKWTLSQKNEELSGENIFYVFVSLNELEAPEYHIVPSKIVADTIQTEHQKWLETPGKKGQAHNDTNIRNFTDYEDTYLDRWDFLEKPQKQECAEAKVPDTDDTKETGIYRKLTDYLPKIQGISYGKWYPKKQTGDGSPENPYQMPHVAYSDVINEFVSDVYLFEKEHPEYGLNGYQQILKQNRIAWNNRSMEGADVSVLDAQAILALILAAIRAERFCDGALLAFFEKGCIQKWLERLRELED